MALQHYVNHISLIVDRSSSMNGQPVVKVFDKELEYLKQRSIDLDQETRISIYLFNASIECLTFDMDVMRFKSLEGYYKPAGMTALLDAVLRSTEEHKRLPEIHGDHAFLQYVITDGQENSSKSRPTALKAALSATPDNWTTACLVPDSVGKFEAKKFGFNEDSIAIWDTNASNAFEKVGTQFSKTIDTYMAMRSQGIRGTTSLFTVDVSKLNKSNLKQLPISAYKVYPVERDGYIREYLEWYTAQPYNIGSAFYQLTKKVKIQDYKNILVQDCLTGKVYEGNNLRQLLGLPSETVNVDPGSHGNWRIFIQSTSTNRKLFKDECVLVRKQGVSLWLISKERKLSNGPSIVAVLNAKKKRTRQRVITLIDYQ